MKRFHWPLQRLLDVTGQRERTQRAALLDLSRQMARGRQETLVIQAELRLLLAETAGRDVAQRVREHEEFTRYAEESRRRIRRLEEQLAELARRRREKTRRLLETRKKRETLERLREEARQEHLREQLKIEQHQFDESAHLTKARRMIEARRLGAS